MHIFKINYKTNTKQEHNKNNIYSKKKETKNRTNTVRQNFKEMEKKQ